MSNSKKDINKILSLSLVFLFFLSNMSYAEALRVPMNGAKRAVNLLPKVQDFHATLSNDAVASRGAAKGMITYNQHVDLRRWLQRNDARNYNNRRKDLEERLGVSGLIDIYGVPDMANKTGHRGHYAIRDGIVYVDADILNGENGELYLKHEIFELIKIIKFGFLKFGDGKAKELGNRIDRNRLSVLIAWLSNAHRAVSIDIRSDILNRLVGWLDQEGNIEEVQRTLRAFHKAAPKLPQENEELVADAALPNWWWNSTFQGVIWKLMQYSTQSTEPLKFYLENINSYSKHGVIEYADHNRIRSVAYVPEAGLQKFTETTNRNLNTEKWSINIPALDPKLSVAKVRFEVEKALMEACGFGSAQRLVRGAAGQERVDPDMYMADIKAVHAALPWIAGGQSLTGSGFVEREISYLRASCQRILWVGEATIKRWRTSGVIGDDAVSLRREVLAHRQKVEEFAVARSALIQPLASGETIVDGTERNEIAEVSIPGTSWVVKLNRRQGEKLTAVDFINRSANISISTYTMYLPEQSLQDIAERISAYFSSNGIDEKDFIKALNTVPGLSRPANTFSNPSVIDTAL